MNRIKPIAAIAAAIAAIAITAAAIFTNADATATREASTKSLFSYAAGTTSGSG